MNKMFTKLAMNVVNNQQALKMTFEENKKMEQHLAEVLEDFSTLIQQYTTATLALL
jgi:hypothetical protein